MRGLQTERTARVISAGHAFTQNLRRGHYVLATGATRAERIATALAELSTANMTGHLVPVQRAPRALNATALLNTDRSDRGSSRSALAALEAESDVQALLERGLFVCDALYAWCARQVAAQ